MLSLRVLGVRDVPRPPPGVVCSTSSSSVLWTVQVNHGVQQHRTHFVATPGEEKKSEEEGHKDPRPAARAPWEKEIDIDDKEDEETVNVALLFELESKADAERFCISTRGRKLFRHAIATINMGVFRAKPDERVELWLPLRCVGSSVGGDDGAIRLAVTYTDDYTARGYMFGLFCGLPIGAPYCRWGKV